MRTAIIVNDVPKNVSLLRFTQTKLFFDAYNVGINYFQDCKTVASYEQAEKIAKDQNMDFVSNKCIKQEYQRLFQKSNPVFPVLRS